MISCSPPFRGVALSQRPTLLSTLCRAIATSPTHNLLHVARDRAVLFPSRSSGFNSSWGGEEGRVGGGGGGGGR